LQSPRPACCPLASSCCANRCALYGMRYLLYLSTRCSIASTHTPVGKFDARLPTLRNENATCQRASGWMHCSCSECYGSYAMLYLFYLSTCCIGISERSKGQQPEASSRERREGMRARAAIVAPSACCLKLLVHAALTSESERCEGMRAKAAKVATNDISRISIIFRLHSLPPPPLSPADLSELLVM